MEQLDESASQRTDAAGVSAGGEDCAESDVVTTGVGDEHVAIVVAPLPPGPDDAATALAEPVLAPVSASDALSLGDVRTGAYAEVLHDEPLQLVIAAMLHLDGLPNQYWAPPVQRAVDLLERATERMRDLVHAMSVADDHDSLSAVVQRAVEAQLGGRGVRFQSVGETSIPLSEPAQHAARAILVAALADIRRRASVATVILDVRTVGRTVVITLQDDGVGRLPPEPRPVKASLADLRARAAAVGGTLDTGPGPVLILTLPAEPGGSATRT